MTTPKSTISEPYNEAPQNSQSFYALVDSTMARASFLGVVSFGRFAPDWGSVSVTMSTIMVNLP
jgi:hypothetical protein